MSDERAARLYETIERYCAVGEHRTGLPQDAATVEWFAGRLREMGGQVQVLPYTFDRYDARWRVTLDGEEVVAMPLFYEGVGDVKTDAPAVTVQQVHRGSFLPEFEPVAQRALADGRQAAVVATQFDDGMRLQAVNRHVQPGSGLPTVCVAGALAERLTESRVQVELSARVETGHSANVLALFGDAPFEDRVLLTTPLSGWFRVAGERGCGIALCLEVARALAEHTPVAVLGTNGHELMGYGSKVYLAGHPPRPRGIFHFGANIAVRPREAAGSDPLPNLTVRGWVPEERRGALAESFAHITHPVDIVPDAEAREPRRWRGEAVRWCAEGVPIVSMVGSSVFHHTPEDLPENATTPALLEAACAGAVRAAEVLMQR